MTHAMRLRFPALSQ
ncbi:erythromycin resistance leader peptide [Ornithinibacillus salinisoli]|uniref:Erythromycin resistance leader peptide n=1 Tax=Ornithinibacillus salinisoli TaxID=1848459 RepID=A0ABW4VZV2_9BACI